MTIFLPLFLYLGYVHGLVPVTTSKGPIYGRVYNGAYVFQGIPFAKPPIQTLRFMVGERNFVLSPVKTTPK